MNVQSFSVSMLDYLKTKNDSENKFKFGSKLYVEAEYSKNLGDSMHEVDCKVFNLDEYPQAIGVTPNKLTIHESVMRNDLYTFQEWVELLTDVADYMEIQDFRLKSRGLKNAI